MPMIVTSLCGYFTWNLEKSLRIIHWECCSLNVQDAEFGLLQLLLLSFHNMTWKILKPDEAVLWWTLFTVSKSPFQRSDGGFKYFSAVTWRSLFAYLNLTFSYLKQGWKEIILLDTKVCMRTCRMFPFLWRILYWLVFRKRSVSFIMAWDFLTSWLVANILHRVVKWKCICPMSSWSWELQLCDMESLDHPLTLTCIDWKQCKQYWFSSLQKSSYVPPNPPPSPQFGWDQTGVAGYSLCFTSRNKHVQNVLKNALRE